MLTRSAFAWLVVARDVDAWPPSPPGVRRPAPVRSVAHASQTVSFRTLHDRANGILSTGGQGTRENKCFRRKVAEQELGPTPHDAKVLMLSEAESFCEAANQYGQRV